jgi:hypothetical protein
MLLKPLCYAFTQVGNTPAIEASGSGHTETLALLLSNNADVTAATEVLQLKMIQTSKINYFTLILTEMLISILGH